MHNLTNSTADALLASFTDSRRRELEPASMVRYTVYLRHFVRWLGERHPEDLTPTELDGYLGAWFGDFEEKYGRRPSRNTQRNHHCALNAFYVWLEQLDHVSSNPLRKLGKPPKSERRRNDYLSEEEDESFLRAAQSPQERIIVYLLRFTGMRKGESLALLQRDVDLAPSTDYPFGRITIRESKTESGERVIPTLPRLLPELQRWFAYIGSLGLRSPNLPVLVTQNRKPMPRAFVDLIVKRVAGRGDVRAVECTCGASKPPHEKGCPRTRNGLRLSDVSPHTLRRTFGSALRREGKPLDAISKALGHSNTAVTERSYVDLEAELAAREILSL